MADEPASTGARGRNVSARSDAPKTAASDTPLSTTPPASDTSTTAPASDTSTTAPASDTSTTSPASDTSTTSPVSDSRPSTASRDRSEARATITSAQDEYLIIQTARPLGLGPLGALFPDMAMVASQFSALSSAQFSALADQLHGPEIKVIEKIMPSGLTAMASIGAPAPPAIIVAQMTHQKAQQVQAQAAGNFFVARNLPLRLADTNPFSGLSFDPSVIHSTGAQLTFTVEVLGDRGPLPNSQVFIFGGVGTTQGITDSSGRATLSMTAESAVTIQGSWFSRYLDIGIV